MTEKDLKERTKQFALRIVKLVNSLPKTTTGIEFGEQIFRSGTSVAANYRAACRAKSNKDFIYKLEVVLEEADETLLWLELISDSETMEKKKLEQLMDETNQLVSIFTKSIITTKNRSQKSNLTSKI
jgi:four helix bundle protein